MEICVKYYFTLYIPSISKFMISFIFNESGIFLVNKIGARSTEKVYFIDIDTLTCLWPFPFTIYLFMKNVYSRVLIEKPLLVSSDLLDSAQATSLFLFRLHSFLYNWKTRSDIYDMSFRIRNNYIQLPPFFVSADSFSFPTCIFQRVYVLSFCTKQEANCICLPFTENAIKMM